MLLLAYMSQAEAAFLSILIFSIMGFLHLDLVPRPEAPLKATKTKCKHPEGCEKYALKGGLCMAHGGTQTYTFW